MSKIQDGFKKRSIALIGVAFVAQFIYSEMLSDIYNTYYSYMAIDGTVWSRSNMTLPITISGYLAIPVLYFGALWMTKTDSRRILCWSTVIVGVCTILLGVTGDKNFPVWFTVMIINNIAGRLMILAVQGVVTNWYISTRGRVMGIYTIAAPLGTAFFPNFLLHLVALTNKGVDPSKGQVYNFVPIWTILGVIIIAFGISCLFLVRSKPEEVGLLPDGIERSAEQIKVLTCEEPSEWSVGRLLKTPETWLLSVGTAAWIWVMNGFMSLFVVAMMTEFYVPPTTSVWYLTISSLLGIVISYAWGVVDDKFGTPVACRGLSVSYFFMSLSMYLAIRTHFMPLIVISVLGIAFASGGIPNLQPSVYAYVYGRKQFMHANKVVMPLMTIIGCPSTYLFTVIQEKTGSFMPVYIICMVCSVVAFICFLFIRKSYDPERLALNEKDGDR